MTLSSASTYLPSARESKIDNADRGCPRPATLRASISDDNLDNGALK